VAGGDVPEDGELKDRMDHLIRETEEGVGTARREAGAWAREKGTMPAETWQACAEPIDLLCRVYKRTSERKLLLLVCGAARLVPGASHFMGGDRGVGVVERYLAGAATVADWIAATRVWGASATVADWWPAYHLAHHVVLQAAETAQDKGILCDLFRCVFGNPFRPLVLAPACRTPTVVSLATVTYEEPVLPSGRLDAVRLAVLADALEEAGADVALLEHLRNPGPHVRGCFPVDLCLAREGP
jgi:hypothetical protein